MTEVMDMGTRYSIDTLTITGIVLGLLGLLAIFSIFYSVYENYYEVQAMPDTIIIEAETEKTTTDAISIDTAIEYLEKSIYSHEFYLNNIEKDKTLSRVLKRVNL